MRRTCVVLFVFVALSYASADETEESKTCPPNEHWTKCKNVCPTPICANPSPPSCLTKKCTAGCDCDEGFIRTKQPDGQCIPRERCENCLNEVDFEYRECGTDCLKTCKSILSGSKVCPRICQAGCYCKGSKVLQESTKKCVNEDECKGSCSRDDFAYNECGSPCTSSCEQILKGRVCAAVCVPGCYCKEGVYDAATDKCVPPEKCKKKC